MICAVSIRFYSVHCLQAIRDKINNGKINSVRLVFRFRSRFRWERTMCGQQVVSVDQLQLIAVLFLSSETIESRYVVFVNFLVRCKLNEPLLSWFVGEEDRGRI